MKISLCCIGRLENQYAVEFVEHYFALGFDKIFIYDNNHDNEEHFEDVLNKYLGNVNIINYRNIEAAQLKAYENCYNNYGCDFDYMAFFDFDEFLYLPKDKNIKTYLSRNIENYDVIKINWMNMSDNDLVFNDKRLLNERFTKPCEKSTKINYNFPENCHAKSIVKCGIKNFIWNGNPHTPGITKLKYCDSNFIKSDSTFHTDKINHETAYLKHFSTKTIDEFINNKLKRGTADRTYKTFLNTYGFKNFFILNKITEDKLKYIKDKGLTYTPNEQPK